MKKMHLTAGMALLGGALAMVWASAAQAEKAKRNTPANWSYELKNGKRVPRAQRTTNADGSWTEERKSGDCKVKREGRDKEVREIREC